jgi:hypothetical protein
VVLEFGVGGIETAFVVVMESMVRTAATEPAADPTAKAAC